MKTPTFDDMLAVVRFASKPVGLNELHLRKSTRSKLFDAFQKLVYVYGFVQEVLLVTGELIFAYFCIWDGEVTREKFLNASETVPCALLSVFSLSKSLRLVVKRQELVELFEEFKAMWPKPNEIDDETKEIIEESLKVTNRYCALYSFVTIFTSSVVYNVSPIIIMIYNMATKGETDYLLPYLIWYPYDYSKRFWVWFATYASQYYAGFYTTGTVVTADCYFALIATHISMHLQLLCRDLKRVPIDDGSGLTLREKLSNVVILHNKLISLCKVAEYIFSPIVLLNIVASSLLICILLFSVSIAPFFLMIKYLMFMASVVTQIFMLSLYGNAIVEKSLLVSFAAYDSAWVDLTGPDAMHFKKSTVIIAVRSQRHLKISAFGFTEVSMDTFASILKAAISYYTLLRVIYQKNDK